MKEQLIRYRPGRDPKPESRTDWDRLKRMSDEEVDQAARNDPDAQPLSDEQLARGFRPNALTALRKRLSLSQTEFANSSGSTCELYRIGSRGAGNPLAACHCRQRRRTVSAERCRMAPTSVAVSR